MTSRVRRYEDREGDMLVLGRSSDVAEVAMDAQVLLMASDGL